MRTSVRVLRRPAAIAAMALATTLGAGLVPAPAQADFNQSWYTWANVRASKDWIPYQTSVSQWGKACSSPYAAWFYIEVKVTSNKELIWRSDDARADDQVYYFGSLNLGINRAYYHKWHTNPDAVNNQAPCQYVGAGGAN